MSSTALRPSSINFANKWSCSDGNIRYFEYENDKFEFLSEYKSGDPQRGIGFMPKRGINVCQANHRYTGTSIANDPAAS